MGWERRNRLPVLGIGQNILRDVLMDCWNAACPLAGITTVRASHIIPWAERLSYAQRFDHGRPATSPCSTKVKQDCLQTVRSSGNMQKI